MLLFHHKGTRFLKSFSQSTTIVKFNNLNSFAQVFAEHESCHCFNHPVRCNQCKSQIKGMQTMTATIITRGKVSAKIDDMKNKIQKLQDKATKVATDNQGKMKKLQRKSTILLDEIKHFGYLQRQLDGVIDMLQRRKLDYLTVYKIGNRTRVVDGDLYFRDEADTVAVNIINARRHSEAFDLERMDTLLGALPAGFRE